MTHLLTTSIQEMLAHLKTINTDPLEHCYQFNKTYFEPSFKSNLVHISIFNEFQSSNCQTVALINLLVGSNATPGTIIETKCGLAETEIQSKVESKSSFLFFSGGTSQSTSLSFGPKQLGCFLFTYFLHNQFYEVTKKLNPIYSLTYSASRLC